MSIFPKNVICETSTINNGNMSFRAGSKKEVTNNRARFLEKFGIAYQEHIAMSCNHGDRITLVDNKHFSVGATEQEDVLQSEVLVTQKKHLALLLLTADCQPVSFFDPTTHTIALAHISRATLVKKLTQKTVHFLSSELGIKPSNLLVHIGPHIKKESYAFLLPLEESVPELLPYTEEKNGYAHIDLLEANIAELIASGIAKEKISVSDIDTGTSKKHYSYFQMKKKGEQDSERMATILMMR